MSWRCMPLPKEKWQNKWRNQMDKKLLDELLSICWRIASSIVSITTKDIEDLRAVLKKIERRAKQRGSAN